MRRTTITLPEPMDARLRYEARRRGLSVAELVREAVASYLPSPEERHLSFEGIGTGPDDTGSEHVDELVAEAVERGSDTG